MDDSWAVPSSCLPASQGHRRDEPATSGTIPSSRNAGSRHSPSGSAARTPTARARSSTRARAAALELVGEALDRGDHGRAGAVGAGQRAAERGQLRVVGERRPDLLRVDAEGEPLGDAGQPVGGRRRAAPRTTIRTPSPGDSPARSAAPSSCTRWGRSRRTSCAGAAYGGRLGAPDRPPGRARPRPAPATQPGRAADEDGGRTTRRAAPAPDASDASSPDVGSRGSAPRRDAVERGTGRHQQQHRQRRPGRPTRTARSRVASTSPAIASIHHRPGEAERQPGRQADQPDRVAEQEAHGSPPAPDPISSASTGRPATSRAVARADASSPSTSRRGAPGAARIESAPRRTASARPSPGAVGHLPGRGEQAEVARHRACGRRTQRRRARRLRGRTPRPPDGSGGQAAAAWSSARPGGCPARELGGQQLAGLEHAGRRLRRRRRRDRRRRARPARRPRHRRPPSTASTADPGPGARPAPAHGARRRRDHRPGRGAPPASRLAGPAVGPAAQPPAPRPATASSGHRAEPRRQPLGAGTGRCSPSSANSTPVEHRRPARRRPRTGTATSRSEPACRRVRRPRWSTTSTAEASWLCAAVAAEPGGQGQRLDPGRDVARGVGVEGAAAALVAGVQRGEQVDHLGAAHLADHQPVGPHPQRLPDQGAQRDLAGALDVGRPGLEARRRAGGRAAARWRPRPGPAARPGRPATAARRAAWSCPSRCRR